MRTISLVKRLKWSFSGNMNPHALVIGDVDNDNVNYHTTTQRLYIDTHLQSS